MDLSVDICSAVYEVVEKKPGISAREAIASGFAVGRAACGSTTTLLLRCLMDRYGAETVTVSHYGVREGYLHQKIQPSLAELP